MDADRYAREVEMLCPTCGGTRFASSDNTPILTCAGCRREMTKDDLVAHNRERIEAQVEELQHDIVEDAGRELKRMLNDALRGNTHFKVK